MNDRIRPRRFPGSSPTHGQKQSEDKNFHLQRFGPARKTRSRRRRSGGPGGLARPSAEGERSQRHKARESLSLKQSRRKELQLVARGRRSSLPGSLWLGSWRHFGGRPGITRVAGSCCSKSIQHPPPEMSGQQLDAPPCSSHHPQHPFFLSYTVKLR